MDKIIQKVFKGKVIDSEVIARGVKRITIKLDQNFQFFPWQYVWVEIPQMKTHDPKGSRRAFSICNTINPDNTIQIIARISDSGYKQSLFALTKGEAVVVHGPFGNSFIIDDEHQPEHIVMIAGGVGIAAYIAMLETIRLKNYKTKVSLFYLNTDEESTPLLSELQKIKEQSNFLDLVVSYQHFSWVDITHSISDIDSVIEWWIAGSKSMVNHVYLELEKGAIPRKVMVFENYYPTQKSFLTREIILSQLNDNHIFAKAIQNSTNHTIITDPEGTILFANKAAEKITGFSETEMLDNTPRLWGGMMSREFYRDFWSKKASGEAFQGKITNRRKNGEIYYAIAHIAPIFGTEKEIIGFIGTEEDVTEILQTEKDLMAITRRFELAVKSAQIGIWEWEIESDIVHWDAQMCALFGLKQDGLVGNYGSWSKVVHPEDLKIRNESIQLALQGKKDYDTSFRVVWPNHQIKHIKVYASVERDKDGKPVKMVGVDFDITKEKQIDLAKTEFVSLASHQLRTPLTTIGWYTEMLLSGDVGNLNDEQKSYLKEVYTGNQRMVTLVNSLLNVSRIDMGTFAIEPRPTNLTELMAINVKEQRPQLEKKKITLVENYDPELPLVNVDPKLIGIVVQNLLSNAIKYTPEAGKITLSLNKNQEAVTFAVADTGYGIPADAHDKIFTKLFRADNVRAKETEGTGLGLYIVKSIVEQSGGKVWFESEENKGTTFYVFLPIRGVSAKPGNKELTA